MYSIAYYKERKGKQYADGLSYNEVKKLKIIKQAIYSLFRLPGTNDIPEISRPHISIEWCTFPPIRDNWMDRWYMVFYIPPHNNREVPMYFHQKLYAEFVMGKHVNYFDMLGFQGVGSGMPQHQPDARHRDANPKILAPHAQLPRADIPPTHDMVA